MVIMLLIFRDRPHFSVANIDISNEGPILDLSPENPFLDEDLISTAKA